MNLWKSGVSLPPTVVWRRIQSKVTTELHCVEWPWQKKHHHHLFKQDFIKGFMEKGNEAVCLWHMIRTGWIPASNLGLCRVSRGLDLQLLFHIHLLEMRHFLPGGTGSRCSTKSNLVWWELLVFNTEHLARISPYAYCSVKPLCNPFSAVMIPQIGLFGRMSICSLPLFQ